MNSARTFALVSRYTGMVLCAAGIGVLGVALTLPSAAEAAQGSKASKSVARKAGKPAPGRVAKTSPKNLKPAAVKSPKQQVAKQTPRRATQMAGIAMPGLALLQVASIRPGAVYVYQDSDLRMDSLNSAPQMAAPYPDEAHAPRKATTACLVNGELFLLADCNTRPGAASGLDSHVGIGRETSAVSPVGHHPLPEEAPGAELPAASADAPPPEPS